MVVAHPDDEIIGAGNYLAELPQAVRRNVVIAYVTGGVPRDLQFTEAAGFTSRADYAAARRGERDSGLKIARLEPGQCVDFGCTDQEACLELPHIAERLARLAEDLQPDLLLTHPYEGGHPDHDACAFVCNQILDRMTVNRRTRLDEFACYHACPSGFATHEFLPDHQTRVSIVTLNAEQRLRKQRMYDCHRSQQNVLRLFSTQHEKFRTAPFYDFLKPPHPGPLHYETLGWKISGALWREKVGDALKNRAIRRRRT